MPETLSKRGFTRLFSRFKIPKNRAFVTKETNSDQKLNFCKK